MKATKFKGAMQKLSFFKDYSSLLTPLIIVVVALLILALALLMGSKHREEMVKKSVSMGNTVKNLSQKAVPRNQWQVEEQYQQVHERDANETALLANQSTQRELLSYKIFPEPKESSTLIFEEFGRRFRSATEGLIARVNARDCPTEAELNKHLQNVSSYSGQTISISSTRGGRSRQQMGEVEATITDALCLEKAKSASVYINPADLAGYEFWADYKYLGREEAIRDCWYWQLSYWIAEDVIDTIDVLNSGSGSVFTSPVKRLLRVSFTTSENELGRETAYDKPVYVRGDADELIRPHTARHCDEDIDVVHFNVAVIVDAKDVFSFMRQLCSGKEHRFMGFTGKEEPQVFRHNQITILKSDIESIYREDELHELYRYGEDAVVKLDLICEYIFKKNGYDEIKPESIKEMDAL